ELIVGPKGNLQVVFVIDVSEENLAARISRLRKSCGNLKRRRTDCDGLIVLLTNGARSVSGRPPLQAAEAKAVKSPASIAAVGTYAVVLAGVWRIVVPW